MKPQLPQTTVPPRPAIGASHNQAATHRSPAFVCRSTRANHRERVAIGLGFITLPIAFATHLSVMVHREEAHRALAR